MLVTYKMSSTSFSTAIIHTWSLSAGLMRLFYPAGFDTVSAFMSQDNNNKLIISLHALKAFYEQAISCTS